AEVLRKVLNASFAASMARRVSAAPERGTVPMVRPVAGLITSMVLPESACTHSPLFRFAWRMKWLDFWSIRLASRAARRNAPVPVEFVVACRRGLRQFAADVARCARNIWLSRQVRHL